MLLKLNHFGITQAESCLKGTFVKTSFIFVSYHFLDIYKNPWRKSSIKPSCPMHPKIINHHHSFNVLVPLRVGCMAPMSDLGFFFHSILFGGSQIIDHRLLYISISSVIPDWGIRITEKILEEFFSKKVLLNLYQM